MPMRENDLLKRDAERDVWQEALDALHDLKAGRVGAEHQVPVSPVAEARHKVGMSQGRFAALMGVSKRTLQDWEQGRRQPSGAARTLLQIAARRPEVLREMAS
jgi:putative transcriptional regulator